MEKVLQPQNFSYFLVKDDFIRWLYSRISKNTVKKLIPYLEKYAKDKPLRNARDVYEIREIASSKKQITIALRNLLNYAEEFGMLDDYTITKMRKVLKVVKSNPDNYIPSTAKVKEVYEKIDKPEYKLLFKILAYSGVRITEGINFLKNYREDKVEVKDNFIRYSLFDIRHTKRVYYIYLPADIKDELKKISISLNGFESYLSKRGLPAKYLRKWNYNFLIMNNVPESICDFLQGRSPVSISSMHYLAKTRQADFFYSKIADDLISVLEKQKGGDEEWKYGQTKDKQIADWTQ